MTTLPNDEVHVTPEPDEPTHRLDGLCWCQPLVEDQPTGGRIYIHRRTLDSAHIEAPVEHRSGAFGTRCVVCGADWDVQNNRCSAAPVEPK